MARTWLDLFRIGNASSPRMDNVRPKDIDMFDRSGVPWVRAGTGERSCYILMMIELSPKALRFARLAAEMRPSQTSAPFVAELKRLETEFPSRRSASSHAFIRVSDDLGRFCLNSLSSLLRSPPDDSEWDENDLLYVRNVADHLSQSLKDHVL